MPAAAKNMVPVALKKSGAEHAPPACQLNLTDALVSLHGDMCANNKDAWAPGKEVRSPNLGGVNDLGATAPNSSGSVALSRAGPCVATRFRAAV